MVYNYVHWWPASDMSYYTEDQRLEITKQKAVQSLAEELLKYATYGIDKNGNAWVRFEV